MDLAEVVRRAGRGDELAWASLVRETTSLLLRVARGYRLGEADALDVCQTTWATLADALPTLREPASLPGWLVTTARRQSLRLLAQRRREIPAPPEPATDASASPEVRALAAERAAAFWRAAEAEPENERRLLTLLVNRPELTYAQLAAEIGVAPGSVGPLRRRCFDRMRRRLVAAGFEASDLC
ncbi:RNA polymerase sigma factor [Amycolatopsis antarctica]|nr:sigma-70 family RNA polymerase sigma factor [Amycolatopsis antarctica]